MRRLTIRARLTLTYAGLVSGCGAAIIATVYLFMRFVPNYQVLAQESFHRSADAHQTHQIAVTQIRSPAEFLDIMLVVSCLALVALAAVGAAVGWIIAGHIIKPLAAINAAAIRAADGALDHRVALGGPRDEIRDLSETFDHMLGSLERSFAAHRRFAANASHELRTPLSTTKTMIDVVLDDPDASASDLRALAERIREVNHANIQTVEALLDLADADSAAPAREPVQLADIASLVVEELTDEARSAGVTLCRQAGDVVAYGDPVLIRQAISNLIRNAVRHNRPGGQATVRVTAHGAGARVAVTNTGTVVLPESIQTLTEPFTRGAGRVGTRGTGHGLGLAIVSAVAVAHRGALSLHPHPEGGLTAHLDLPNSAGPPDNRRYRARSQAAVGARGRRPTGPGHPREGATEPG